MFRLASLLSFLLLALIARTTSAQNQLGMRLEHMAGVWSAAVNPANTVYYPLRWDVNLAAGDIFAENSYAYLRNSSLPHLLRNLDTLVSVESITPENPAVPGALIQDFFPGRRRMHSVGVGRLTLPSFTVKIGKQHTIGLFVSIRGGGGGYGVPGSMAYYNIAKAAFRQGVQVPRMNLAGMVWREIGLHYAWRNTEDSDYTVALGVTPKLLAGFEGGFAKVNNPFIYRRYPGKIVEFAYGQWSYGLTTENAERVIAGQDPALTVHGRGFGLDIGASVSKPANYADTDLDYVWRAGLSVLDVGAVNFNRFAEQHNIDFKLPVRVDSSTFINDTTPAQLIQRASRVFLGDSSASLVRRGFTIGTPSALSLQFDFRVMPGFYVSGIFVQRIPFWQATVRRPNTLAIAPRFESRWLAVSLPVVFDDYQSLRLGVSARLGSLVIGSDNIAAFTGEQRLSGLDFYIGLKINAFKITMPSPRLGRSGRKWFGVGCFDF